MEARSGSRRLHFSGMQGYVMCHEYRKMARPKRLVRRQHDTMLGVHPDEEAAIVCAMRESLKTCNSSIATVQAIDERTSSLPIGLAVDLVDYQALQTLTARKRKGRKQRSGPTHQHSALEKNMQKTASNETATTSLKNKGKSGKFRRNCAMQKGTIESDQEHSTVQSISGIMEEIADSVVHESLRRSHSKYSKGRLSKELKSTFSSESTTEDEDVILLTLADDLNNDDESRDESDSDFEPVKKKKPTTSYETKNSSTTSSPCLVQRKFAHNVDSRSSNSTPVRATSQSVSPQSSTGSLSSEHFPKGRPSTKDFITFLCLRGIEENCIPRKYKFFQESWTQSLHENVCCKLSFLDESETMKQSH